MWEEGRSLPEFDALETSRVATTSPEPSPSVCLVLLAHTRLPTPSGEKANSKEALAKGAKPGQVLSTGALNRGVLEGAGGEEERGRRRRRRRSLLLAVAGEAIDRLRRAENRGSQRLGAHVRGGPSVTISAHVSVRMPHHIMPTV